MLYACFSAVFVLFPVSFGAKGLPYSHFPLCAAWSPIGIDTASLRLCWRGFDPDGAAAAAGPMGTYPAFGETARGDFNQTPGASRWVPLELSPRPRFSALGADRDRPVRRESRLG